jgi:sugar phosphate isomerase/epimerase
MRLSCSAASCPTLRLPEALAFVKQAGLDAIELFRDRTESTPVHPDFSVRTVREHLQAAGIRLAGLTVRNLTGRKADSDERNLDYNLRQVSWDIHLGRALGLKHASLSGGARTDEALEDLVAGVNRLLEALPADFELNLANGPENRLQGLADFQSVMPQVGPRAKVLLDAGNLMAAGEDVMAFAEAFAGRVGMVRLRDHKGGKPAALGQGDLPLKGLLKVLKKAGFNGEMILAPEPAEGEDALSEMRAAREQVEKALAGP